MFNGTDAESEGIAEGCTLSVPVGENVISVGEPYPAWNTTFNSGDPSTYMEINGKDKRIKFCWDGGSIYLDELIDLCRRVVEK